VARERIANVFDQVVSQAYDEASNVTESVMLKRPQLAIIVVISLCTIDLGAECVPVPRKPVKVAGAICGRVFDTIAGLEPDTELLLYDQGDVVVAAARADSNANFKFPVLPKGKYRIQAKDWTISWGNIEVTSSTVAICKQPVVVYVGLPYPDCSGGWVNKSWDFRHFPDGPPRE
jgi:hypothetical protein